MAVTNKIHKLRMRKFMKTMWEIESMDDEGFELESIVEAQDLASWVLQADEKLEFKSQTVRLVKNADWEIEMVGHDLEKVH